MTVTTTIPLDKITNALDVLQNYGVIGDNQADHCLGEWLEDNALTADDLNNYQQPRADEAQMDTLALLLLQANEDHPKELARVLAYHLTDGGRPDLVDAQIKEYQDCIGHE